MIVSLLNQLWQEYRGFDLIQIWRLWLGKAPATSLFKSGCGCAGDFARRSCPTSDFKGSWAGAMGLNQFMPTSWSVTLLTPMGTAIKIFGLRRKIFFFLCKLFERKRLESELSLGEVSPRWFRIFNYLWLLQKSKTFDGMGSYGECIFRVDRFRMVRHKLPSGLLFPMEVMAAHIWKSSNFETILSWNRSDYLLCVVYYPIFIASQTSGTSLHLNP